MGLTTYIIRQIFQVESGRAVQNTNAMTDALAKTASAEQSVKTGAIGMAAAVQTAGASSAAAVATVPPILRESGKEAREFETRGVGAFARVKDAAGPLIGRIGAVALAYIGLQQGIMAVTTATREQIAVETSALSMAALIDSNFQIAGKQGGEKFAASMALASGYVERLARKSAELPGEFKDFVGISAAIAGPLFAANQNLDELLAKTGDIAILSQVIPGARSDDVGNQVSRILQGQAGADNPVAMFLKSTGMLKMEFEKFNALPVGARARATFEAISQLVGNPAFKDAIGHSSAVQLSTLRDNLTGVVGILGHAGTVLKRGLVEEAMHLNDWFARNPDKVRKIGEDIGTFVLTPLRAVSRSLEFILEHEDQILNVALAIGAATATWKLAGIIGADAGAIGGLAQLGKGAMDINVIKALLPASFAASPFLSAGAASAAAPALAAPGMGALLASMVSALPAIAVGAAILVTVFAGIYGAFMVIKNDILGLGSFFRGSMGSLGHSLFQLGKTLGGLFTALAVPLGVVLVPLISIAAYALSGLVQGLTSAINTIGGFAAFLGAFLGDLSVSYSVSDAFEAGAKAFKEFKFEDVSDYYNKAAQKRAKEGEQVDATSVVNNNFFGDIQVNQRFEKDESIDRIAIGWTDQVTRRRPKSPAIRPLKGY